MTTKITRQAYLEELARLRKEVYEMGEKVSEAIDKSMTSLIARDKIVAREVMQADDIIDNMNVEIEDRCMLLIAKQQPLARDLRIIATGLKISTDLERIGDHAYDIAKITVESDKSELAFDFKELTKMASFAQQMLAESIEAYHTFDVKLAEKICRDDDVVDQMYADVFCELSKIVVNDAVAVKQATQFIFVARYLERIADHATNIAEWVIYLATGDRIRKL